MSRLVRPYGRVPRSDCPGIYGRGRTRSGVANRFRFLETAPLPEADHQNRFSGQAPPWTGAGREPGIRPGTS